MTLEIITPEKKLFSGEVNSVKFPGTNGEFEILNNHAPIISTLSNGEIRVITNDKDTKRSVSYTHLTLPTKRIV